MASSGSEFIQPEVIERLKRSKKVVGERYPVLWDDRRNEPVAGSHRLRSGWKWVKHIRTKDDLEFWRLKMHENVQRGVPMSEFAHDLIAYGEVMEKAGASNEEIIKELLTVSYFDRAYTYTFIPSKWKGTTRPVGKIRKSESLDASNISPLAGEPVIETRSPDEHFFRQHECPNCHTMLRVTATGLEIV